MGMYSDLFKYDFKPPPSKPGLDKIERGSLDIQTTIFLGGFCCALVIFLLDKSLTSVFLLGVFLLCVLGLLQSKFVIYARVIAIAVSLSFLTIGTGTLLVSHDFELGLYQYGALIVFCLYLIAIIAVAYAQIRAFYKT